MAVDGAGDKLFPRTGFTRNQDRGIAWRCFRDKREHGLQGSGGSDNLFRHRGFIDFFTESKVFPLESFLRSLAVFDVGEGAVPARNLPQFAATRVVTSQ